MSTQCFTPVLGRRLRLTRLDSCGRPAYGVNSVVTSGGFVSVAYTAEVKDGTEIERENASGEICVSRKAEDQLKWINAEMTFCQVDPDIATLLNPGWEKLLDYRGNTIGWAERYTTTVPGSSALEVWSDVEGDDVCDDPTATGAWVYFLLAFMRGGTLSDLTVENDAINFVFTSRTRKNSKWGVGPHNVMLNQVSPLPAAAVPGPLLTPVNRDEPRRIFLTTVPPPAAMCGAQPLSNPLGPNVVVIKDVADVTGMTAKATPPVSGGPFTVNWGDGSAQATLPGIGASHLYATPGTYYVSVWPTATPLLVTVRTITVPFP